MRRYSNKTKVSLAAMLLASSLSVPTSANAACCDVGAVVGAVNAASSAITSAISASTSAITAAILNLSSQNHADAERQNAVQKALSEAEQNYDKQYKLQEHAAAIEAKYGSVDANSQQQSDACEAIAIGSNLGKVIQDKRETKNALANETIVKNTMTEDVFTPARNTLKVHADNFCSDADKERGRCSKVAPPELQGADLKASNLFEPNETMTYGEKESIAAKEFINNLVSANPTPALSKRAEATPAGRTYLAAQYTEQRKLDVAAHSLREIFASREEEPGLGRKVNMNTENASVMGVIQHYASKFLDPAWTASFGAMNETDMLREQTRMMAFKTWMDYQSFLQAERTEAIVAMQSLDQIKANAAGKLEPLRQKAMSRAR
ncbi:MAG: hypothetical protein CTY35_00420 [Methylotenera sp.]|uniref:hypothetical protein n=1 Tax=Methylotenera sp. TaxID=2051956 RepID=UPI000D410807|nr:hypothetical protein [Methylotenera sp.]PPC84819.1 MAG: hypothetical protein CTY38_00415 [Methylotenera sp.]PPD02179.1 MAG: hypothetical protein CTY35_00420 [Methylotenera sp.]